MHLGNTLVSGRGKDIRHQDVKNKRAAFINRNNEILQEFYFSHPKTKSKLMSIYNSHFYGSVLWSLGSKEVVQLEKSWNVSVRRAYNLPWQAHCYLVEAISDEPHLRTVLARRFLSFIESVRNSKKRALTQLLKVVEYDTMSVTGKNLRNILMRTDMSEVRRIITKPT